MLCANVWDSPNQWPIWSRIQRVVGGEWRAGSGGSTSTGSVKLHDRKRAECVSVCSTRGGGGARAHLPRALVPKEKTRAVLYNQRVDVHTLVRQCTRRRHCNTTPHHKTTEQTRHIKQSVGTTLTRPCSSSAPQCSTPWWFGAMNYQHADDHNSQLGHQRSTHG